MGITLADQYYLKAWDNYGYDVEETVENLNYALSYNKEHSNANCLMGRVYSELLNEPDTAMFYFEHALSQNLTNIEAIKHYCQLLIKLHEFDKAKNMVKYGYTIKGINKAMLMHFEALIAEYQKDYKKAKELLKTALEEAFSKNEIDFLNEELTRVKNKLKKVEKAKKKNASDLKKKQNKKKKQKDKKMSFLKKLFLIFKRK